ncbi:MAG: VWA domain-containing protein [Acidobacteria bacterium]|nr:VWA domain-containing protein [Acidobacteriota bacterium]
MPASTGCSRLRRASLVLLGVTLASTRSLIAQVAEEVSVPIVKVYASVRSDSGRPLGGLKLGDFTVLEDGRPQEVVYFSQESLPLKIGIVIDCSLSMEGSMEDARRAAIQLLRKLAPEDQALVIGFSDKVDTATELTTDRAALERTVSSMYAHGGTAVYDALHMAILALRGQQGKSAIVLLSDGKDEAYLGGRPGSKRTYEDVSNEIAHTQISLFPVCFWRGNASMEFDVERKHLLKDIFESMAKVSGGRCTYTQAGSGLVHGFMAVLEELRTQYNLYYTPRNSNMDGKWREITVVLNRPVRDILHRQGYFASR